MERFRKVHGELYDYTISEIPPDFPVKTQEKISIRCTKCGIIFKQAVYAHYRGQGCSNCNRGVLKSPEKFIKQASEKFPFIDFSKAVYKNKHSLLELSCPLHGKFSKPAGELLRSLFGCPSCGRRGTNQSIKDLILEVCPKLYNNFYTYPRLEEVYKLKDVIVVTCPIHGDFITVAGKHLNKNRYGSCNKCRGDTVPNRTLENYAERFFSDAKKRHGERFNYESSVYLGMDKTIVVFCNTCQTQFSTTPKSHLKTFSGGCPFCSRTRRKTAETFIQNAMKVHGSLYDYSRVIYRSNKTKVEIICPTHGIFITTPNRHLLKQGCPRCNKNFYGTSAFERQFIDWIIQRLEAEYFIRDSPPWMLKKELDLYIPDLKLAFEFNGLYWHSSERLSKDYHKIKTDLCNLNGITLIHIFQFENATRWKRILSNYLKNPSAYQVAFSNEKRVVNRLGYYGKTKIIPLNSL